MAEQRPMAVLFRVILLACFALACRAYPAYYINSPNKLLPAMVAQPSTKPGCLDHPAAAYGPHAAPMPDTTSTLELMPQGEATNGGNDSLCLGRSYDIKVTFGMNSSRFALLTASAGQLQPSNPFFNETTCTGKRFIPYVRPRPTSFQTVLFVPCNTTAKNVTLRMTSVEEKSGNFMDMSMVLSVGACGTAPCKDVLPIYPPPPPPMMPPSSPPKPKGSAAVNLQGSVGVAVACALMAVWRLAAGS